MLAANFRQVTAENANSVVPRRCGSAAGDEAGVAAGNFERAVGKFKFDHSERERASRSTRKQ